MQITPKTSLALNVVYFTLTGVSVPVLTSMGVDHPEQVAAWATFLSIPINAFLHGVSSPDAGPLAPNSQQGRQP